jgi:16S rRNA (uracil1498-N3)-methyltransferase
VGARRFFVANAHAVGDRLSIAGSDAHKITNVLRLHDGDEIEIADSATHVYRASLHIDGHVVAATLEERVVSPATSSVVIDVAQGVPKGSKMDFVVEKLSELGVATIIPVESERTVVREVGDNKLERWRRLAKAAAAQCGRTDIAEITSPLTFSNILKSFPAYDAVLFPWELATGEPLRIVLPHLVADAKRILVVIGPEGGFSHAEADAATMAGATVISLGSQILRTETAALVLLSVLRYLII